MPTSRRRPGVVPHSARGWKRRRNWASAIIGPNTHPRKVIRWFKALKIGDWGEDYYRKAAARHAKTR